MRHQMFALCVQRQERVGRGHWWPLIIAQAHYPQMTKLQTCRFKRAENLNGRIWRLGLKWCFISKLAQIAQGLRITYGRRMVIYSRKLIAYVKPLVELLI